MVQVKFSDMGEGMNEGEIIHYFVGVGDVVSVDQPLVEMQTDKMVAEIPAPAAGTIASIHYKEGDVVTVGNVIMEITTEAESAAPLSEMSNTRLQSASTTIATKKNATTVTNPYNRILAAPYTRKIARELGVDIEQIQGTGPAGRVLDDDVYQFAEQPETNKWTEEQESATQKLPQAEEEIRFAGIRKRIAEKMSYSVQTIPHVTHYDEVDLTHLLEERSVLKEMGESISVAAFFIKAVVICLKEFPIFNAQLEVEKEIIRLLKQYSIGIATHTEAGLMVPVIHDADQKSIRFMDEEMKRLIKKAKAGDLKLADMKQATFTVNNVGPLGGMAATPIINHPETAIMTFYKTKKVPVVTKDDALEIRSVMNVSVTFDHRVMDGAQSIAFTNRFKELIEHPTKLLLELI
ncbi:dihydrolipoamide acetyltransferase component of pyruvate dehydrogenase complex [Virgibacillus pantothenticus]|uniref:Dihydrolipoamide acetyltransferase component of pyruvate dehydrogenase complex n=1 Tax=Virgibacillus pantothenticus TaxID=1473 RepID=A0A0L0QW50_VIRPA|nr:dihydrolipoamide acetyltransferase family protein [Virgibacillus pantothenticus]KNE22428.1 dihydrolipoyllysine acetyltransferase [Virgibacillus pantothenticus]MED3736327.1 dihydrolipoamide acetyltransferase family protein [Virgibacillus pantothenticus]QTY16886.1 2-oxo acid dehydrogenase subunit E2 [Virgibacillus pantothenticus]SIS85814.1 pyruvate dehydrogenase E2 component (dihydrolipoamide acetyltransferase) [Virgibacillus pantothenticus]GIP63297.1 dihydrolipoamide acetyltransferase compon